MIKITLILCVVTFVLGVPHTPRALVPTLDGRIVGGNDTEIENYPWQISLQYFNSHMCGGSLISATWVVTAAHCTQRATPTFFSVRAGTSLRGSGGQVAAVVRIINHPGYNPSTIDNDVSLLQIAQPFTHAFARTVPMAETDVAVGATATVTGWGTLEEGGSLPTQLQAVLVPIVSQDTCRQAYGTAAITDSMLCAGFVAGGMDACQGDSGGPLVVNGLLAGIVSWGRGCARPNYPGVYASVPYLRNWIRENSGV